MLRNCLSIDVESFAEANVESFRVADEYLASAPQAYELEKNVDAILAILYERQVKATFFFLGRIAVDSPQVVRTVAECGHEIACHSFHHRRIFGLRQKPFKEQLRRAKDALESVSGQRVYGFRAPDFSITDKSLWALDALAELGFWYDSSIYPIRGHDVYGIASADRFISRLPNGMVEWPPSTLDVLGFRIPIAGGGYHRLFPVWITNTAIASLNRRHQPSMFYIHPYEVGPVMPKISGLSAYRRFRHYHNCDGGGKRMERVLERSPFGPAIEILEELQLVNRSEDKSHVA